MTRARHSCVQLGSSKFNNSKFPQPRGFALPGALASFVVFIITSLLFIRASQSLVSSILQQYTKEALALAEAGLETTLAALNTTHPYLLAQNHDPSQGTCWAATGSCPLSTATFPTIMCRDWTSVQQQAVPLTGTVINNGTVTGIWRVVSYKFKVEGVTATGTLRVEGLRKRGDTGPTLAQAQVEQEVSVLFKRCSPASSITRPIARGINRWVSYKSTP